MACRRKTQSRRYQWGQPAGPSPHSARVCERSSVRDPHLEIIGGAFRRLVKAPQQDTGYMGFLLRGAAGRKINAPEAGRQ
eukprot:3371008-Rhodomonas_salina.1